MYRKMNVRNLIVKICVVTLSVASMGLGALPVQTARAQVSAFLGTPYYGNDTTISQWFDPPHYGIDFLLRYERVLAAADGTITTLKWDYEDDRCLNDPTNEFGCGYGLHIRIQHAYDYDDYLTIYGHLSTAIGSTSGPESWVDLGDVIGTSGNTGYSTGPHLHFEVRHDNVAVDPFDEDDALWLHGACTARDGNRCSGTQLPAPPQAGSITIDDGDTGFSRGYIRPYSSPWTYATDAGYNGDTYYGSNTTSSTYYRWAKWQPSLSSANQGMYEVYVHVPSNHATTLRAKYTVNHAYGSTEALIVQAALPHTGWPNSTWVNIGTYFLSPDSRSVEITNETDAWDASKYVGADAVRFTRLAPTYLPNTRASGGWDSSVIVRANGGAALTRVEFFDSSGNSECAVSLPVHQAGMWECDPSLLCDDTGDIRSAVVYASQDVSVVVENIYSSGSRYMAAAYPGETAPAATVYAPYVVQKWFSGHSSWRQTTDLIIQNTGAQQASVTITFYDSWGGYSGSHEVTRTIPANGQITLSGTEMPDNWESWSGVSLASAVIESDQPVAVVARTYTGAANSSGNITTPYLAGSYRAFTSGADEVYLPVAAREYCNYDSSLQVQNARNGYTSFRVKYYYQDGDQAGPTFYRTVGPYRSENLWRPSGLPSDFLGSAVVEVTYGGPVVAMAQYDTFNTSQNRYGVNQYEGVTAGTRSEVLPHVQGDESVGLDRHYGPEYGWEHDQHHYHVLQPERILGGFRDRGRRSKGSGDLLGYEYAGYLWLGDSFFGPGNASSADGQL